MDEFFSAWAARDHQKRDPDPDEEVHEMDGEGEVDPVPQPADEGVHVLLLLPYLEPRADETEC